MLKKMSLLIISAMLTFACSGGDATDKDGPAEKAGEAIDQKVEEAGEKIEEGAEKAGEKLKEAGEKVEEALEGNKEHEDHDGHAH